MYYELSKFRQEMNQTNHFDSTGNDFWMIIFFRGPYTSDWVESRLQDESLASSLRGLGLHNFLSPLRQLPGR